MWDLDRLERAGAAAWPGVVIPRAALAATVGDRLGADDLRGDELYLAVALELGDPAALGAFERQLVPGLRAALGRACSTPAVIDEVIQVLRVRVLVGSADERPKIAQYTARGTLLAWLRVAAMRTLSNLARADRRGAAPASPSTLDAAQSLAWPSPERLLLGERFGSALRGALQDGLRALAPRDRTLLRLHYLEGLPLDRIGALYAVNKSTVSRWLAGAREDLLQRALAAVRAEAITADTEELESLCTYLCSRLELSLAGLLEPPP